MKTLRPVCVVFGFFISLSLWAQVPQLISYQGRLGAGGTNFSGMGQFKFALVNGTGAVSFWSNDGTSVGGSQPAAALALSVSQGLFNVLLGDVTVPNMTVIPASVFVNSDVRLRIWFNDGVHGFSQLTPDQRIAAVGYAMMAGNVPDGSITASKIANGAVTGAKLADGSIPASKLASGAVQQSLQEAGQSGVASGGIILSQSSDSQSLSNAGYIRIGSADVVRESWQLIQGPAPIARTDHTAIWTGSEIIIWGGYDGRFGFLNDGAAYNPALNRWRTIATNTFLAPRRYHSAVWTGTQMIIFGGSYRNGQGNTIYLGDAAMYDPVANAWQQLPAINPGPTARAQQAAVWTGTEMIIFGGLSSIPSNYTGMRYNPATAIWTPLPTIDAPSGGLQSAVWTGTEMIVWSGNPTLGGGGRYNVSSNKWSSMAFLTAPSFRINHTAVWTGTEMIVWGGETGGSSSTALNSGGKYNPATDTWVTTRTVGAPSARSSHTAVWTGSEMLVWGGANGSSLFDDGARYNPATNGWNAITETRSPGPRNGHTAAWTGSEMVVWGGYSGAEKTWPDGWGYNPLTNSWQPVPASGLPRPLQYHTAVWTGSEMIVWGGDSIGVRYNPLTDIWLPVSSKGAPPNRYNHSAVWTGIEMIIWGGATDVSQISAVGARYNPVTDTWTPTDDVTAPSPRTYHTAVWTGTHMIVWGGSHNPPFVSNDGAKYDPVNDLWTPLSVSNAPSARYLHSSVWSGNEMIVWGGLQTNEVVTKAGGRYNPTSDTWIATPQTHAPTERRYHSALWTGTEMIIWGGLGPANPLNAGARYNPLTDIWTPTSLTSAPDPVLYHTAVWSGREMIIWGGSTPGGRYDPASDTWMPITASGPLPRTSHTAVWTGANMLIAGGTSDVASGGNTTYRYIPPRALYVYLLP